MRGQKGIFERPAGSNTWLIRYVAEGDHTAIDPRHASIRIEHGKSTGETKENMQASRLIRRAPAYRSNSNRFGIIGTVSWRIRPKPFNGLPRLRCAELPLFWAHFGYA